VEQISRIGMDTSKTLDRAPVMCRGKVKDRFRWGAALWRSFPNDRNRRVPVTAGRLGEGPFTIQFADVRDRTLPTDSFLSSGPTPWQAA
jgi:hypothetical protein